MVSKFSILRDLSMKSCLTSLDIRTWHLLWGSWICMDLIVPRIQINMFTSIHGSLKGIWIAWDRSRGKHQKVMLWLKRMRVRISIKIFNKIVLIFPWLRLVKNFLSKTKNLKNKMNSFAENFLFWPGLNRYFQIYHNVISCLSPNNLKRKIKKIL